jgi:hypothetical protein
MASILPIPNTCEKTERGYFYLSRFGEKTLSVFQNSFFFYQKCSRKTNFQTLQKMVFLFSGKVVFGGESGISDPP